MKKHESNLVIFSVMLCWAAAYVFIKSLPEELSDFGYLALMNGIAALVLVLFFFPRFKKLNKSNIVHGVILGALMMLVLLFEKEGIERLTSSSASILTALDIVIVPLFLLFFHKKPTKNQLIAIFFILAGVLFTNGLSLKDFPIAGTLFMLGDTVCMSLYTIVANKYCREDDSILLAINQIVFMAVASMIIWCVLEPGMIFKLEYTSTFITSIVILALFTKAYAYIMLMYGEEYGDPVDIVIIFALEPVVTLFLAVFIPEGFGGVEEEFSVMTLIGALFIAVGAIVAEVDVKSIIMRLKGGAKHEKA